MEVLLPEAMAEHGFDLWLVFTRESSRDPIAADVAGGQVVARGAFLFARTTGGFRKIAVVASYDVTPVQESGIYDEVVAYRNEGIKPHLKRIVEELSPQRIGINISRDVPTADGLTVGMRNYLEETLGPAVAAHFLSAQPLVVSFRGRRLPEEVVVLREAATYTDKIMREALSAKVITAGKTTEKDVADYLGRCTEEFGARMAFVSVVVGPSRGHGGPSERVIQPGDLVRIDFGITHRGYSTDVQRTAYVLRPGETGPPAEIQKMWETARAATDAAIAVMRPGVTGNAVDTAGRTRLIAAGYQGYPHGAGHAIGFDVHDVGPMLGPDWPERYGATVFLKLEKDQTFAVEPILYADYPPMGGEINIGLEEDVVVTAEGTDRLHPRQDELILIAPPHQEPTAGAQLLGGRPTGVYWSILKKPWHAPAAPTAWRSSKTASPARCESSGCFAIWARRRSGSCRACARTASIRPRRCCSWKGSQRGGCS
ncbi:MAG: aminopeptidase P family protein [Acidobacteria bacterium]|nr:aminopeptidase P family protein [Acidobacteriota bacterium]